MSKLKSYLEHVKSGTFLQDADQTLYVVDYHVFSNLNLAKAYQAMQKVADELNGGRGSVPKIVEASIDQLDRFDSLYNSVKDHLTDEQKAIVQMAMRGLNKRGR
jgi:hypothetical protein